MWVGTSIENQHYADERIPLLLQTAAAVRFISAEPLLGELNFRGWFDPGWVCSACCDVERGILEYQSVEHEACRRCGATNPWNDKLHGLDWVIVGGESGPGARPFDLAWARSIVEQCQAAGVPVFVKQLGPYPADSLARWATRGGPILVPVDSDWRLLPRLKDRKGGDPAEWPADLNVRQFPEARA